MATDSRSDGLVAILRQLEDSVVGKLDVVSKDIKKQQNKLRQDVFDDIQVTGIVNDQRHVEFMNQLAIVNARYEQILDKESKLVDAIKPIMNHIKTIENIINLQSQKIDRLKRRIAMLKKRTQDSCS